MEEKCRASVGGSALIEGLLMIGPKNAAIAIRKSDGEIVVDKRDIPKRDKLTKIPFVRGVVSFFRQMILVTKALMFSASFIDLEGEEEEEPSKFEKKLTEMFGDKMTDIIVYISIILSILLSVGLFMLLPNFLTDVIFRGLLGFEVVKGVSSWQSTVMLLFEGVLKLTIFFTYIYLASLLEDMKRVWQYHGAEHKTIHCYEADEELTVENIRKYSTKHPRCGTSFMVIVLIISICVFALFGWKSTWINILIRLAMVAPIAGISYEILKWAGTSKNKFVKILSMPGMWFQRLTTKEPDDQQIEVAIAALKAALPEEEEKEEVNE